jgi:hypothetical protein
MGPEAAVVCAAGAVAGCGGDGEGAAHPLNAIKAIPQIVRFKVVTLMSGPAAGRFLLVDFVAVHWSMTPVWLTCDKAVEEL